MEDFDILDVRFTFKRRPLDLSGDLRPNWRVPVLVLMLRFCCRGGKSSLFKLHLLNLVIRDKEKQDALIANLSGLPDYSNIRIQVEPSFIRAIQFAVGEGLAERLENNRIKLTQKGKQLASDIEESNCLTEEKAFFVKLGVRLTENWVKDFSMWSKSA
jgi:hypothetical protein